MPNLITNGAVDFENRAKGQIKQKVLEMVDKIPMGKATNFGTIGARVGISARVVGFVLSGMSEIEMQKHPWHRVVAKNGYISTLKMGYKGEIQRQILVEEGFEIVQDRVDMAKVGYYFEGLN
jgi:methylated-DNA-protein-cysteine methyltransferase-like protein